MTTSVPQIFNYGNQEVRSIMIGGEPWFAISDVCSVLDIHNVTSLIERLKYDGVGKTYLTDRLGRVQETSICNEENLNRIIFRSNKKEAEEFQTWVFGEVLPSIRKTGTYTVPTTGWINERFHKRRLANKELRVHSRFTIDEAVDDMSQLRHFQGLDFSFDAFPDTSIGKIYYPWQKENGYPQEDIMEIYHLVGWKLLANGNPDYEFEIHSMVKSYLHESHWFGFQQKFLREYYWPEKFIPYLKGKYKGKERAENIECAHELINEQMRSISSAQEIEVTIPF